MHRSRFSLWAVALLTFVSFCAARTIITTQTCSTRYCGYAVAKPFRTTKTVHKSTPYTVTRWKTTVKPAVTKSVTVTATARKTSTTTLTAVTSTIVIWIGTSTHTRKFTVNSPSYTATQPITTVTVTPPGRTISAAPGFIGVNDDPDNKSAALDVLKRRAAEPEPTPAPNPEPIAAAAQKYVTAVTCVKTYITKTGTSDLWKTTTKTSGTTTKTVVTTSTWWVDLVTVTKKGAPTARITTSRYKVAFATATITSFYPATSYATTVTSTLPVSTNILACRARNQGPPPAARQRFVIADGAGPDAGEWYTTIYNNGTAYDCCASCHTWKGPGQCIGSVYNYIGPWGPPNCDWEHDENCQWPEFENITQCDLVLAQTGPGTCRRHSYFYTQSSSYPSSVVSNGPNCNRFKYKKRPD